MSPFFMLSVGSGNNGGDYMIDLVTYCCFYERALVFLVSKCLFLKSFMILCNLLCFFGLKKEQR